MEMQLMSYLGQFGEILKLFQSFFSETPRGSVRLGQCCHDICRTADVSVNTSDWRMQTHLSSVACGFLVRNLRNGLSPERSPFSVHSHPSQMIYLTFLRLSLSLSLPRCWQEMTPPRSGNSRSSDKEHLDPGRWRWTVQPAPLVLLESLRCWLLSW